MSTRFNNLSCRLIYLSVYVPNSEYRGKARRKRNTPFVGVPEIRLSVTPDPTTCLNEGLRNSALISNTPDKSSVAPTVMYTSASFCVVSIAVGQKLTLTSPGGVTSCCAKAVGQNEAQSSRQPHKPTTVLLNVLFKLSTPWLPTNSRRHFLHWFWTFENSKT